jgi:hypothetical protein
MGPGITIPGQLFIRGACFLLKPCSESALALRLGFRLLLRAAAQIPARQHSEPLWLGYHRHMLRVKLLDSAARLPVVAHPGEDLGYFLYPKRA